MFDVTKAFGATLQEKVIGAIHLSMDMTQEEIERFQCPIETYEELANINDQEHAMKELATLQALIENSVISIGTIKLVVDNVIDEYYDTK